VNDDHNRRNRVSYDDGLTNYRNALHLHKPKHPYLSTIQIKRRNALHRAGYISHSAVSGRELNDFRIFKKGLTPEEVQILYTNTGIAPPAPAPNPQELLAAKSGGYRYGFQGQERMDEVRGAGNSWDYKYRMHDARLGRFFAVDPLYRDYIYNSTYAFSENRVLDAIELEGREAYFIHGTIKAWGIDYTGHVHSHQMESTDLRAVGEIFGSKTINRDFNWDGLNNDKARQSAGAELANHILNTRTGSEPITLIGHSHGGNVAIEAVNILVSQHNIPADQINIIAVNTPAEKDIQLANLRVNMFAVSSPTDIVQRLGSDYSNGNGVVVRNADVSIWYEDQIEESGIEGDHLGIERRNVKVWKPELESAVKAHNKAKELIPIDKIKTDIQEKQDNTSTKYEKHE
jgi:hypothetical protein